MIRNKTIKGTALGIHHTIRDKKTGRTFFFMLGLGDKIIYDSEGNVEALLSDETYNQVKNQMTEEEINKHERPQK